MRLLAISDTHSRTDQIDNALPMIRAMRADVIVHLGDYVRDAQYLSKKLGVEVLSVPGNGDFGVRRPAEFVLDFGDKKLLICHGHTLSAKTGLDRLRRRALELHCDAVLFGHTHQAHLSDEDGLLLLNPGSMGYAYGYGDKLGIGVLELENGRLAGALL